MGVVAAAMLSVAAQAQTPPANRPAPAAQPAPQLVPPDAVTAQKMIWSTMAAVDSANITGNYSVLRDLGAPSFQANNTPTSLAGVFQNLRNGRVDLSAVLLVTPNYDIPPTIIEGGLLRIRGIFPLRPAIAFDLLYQPTGGRWALFGIAVAPLPQAPPPSQRR
jgi:hypothetical protein